MREEIKENLITQDIDILFYLDKMQMPFQKTSGVIDFNQIFSNHIHPGSTFAA